MLNKSTEVDLIEVVGTNVQVRTATIIKEDDTELSRSFHRHVLQPGDDLTDQDPKVVAIATAVWSL
jgi:flagellar hook assembly protein FlgD